MTRRDFIKVLLSGTLYTAARPLFAQSFLGSYDVGIAVGSNVEQAVRRAIDLVGGIRRYVKPGDKVVVKPNIAWNSPPHLKANTDPLVVRAVVHLCFEALAAKVYVFDRTCSNPKLSYVTSGIARAAKEAGADVSYVDKVNSRDYKKIKVPGGVFLSESLVNRTILESDVLINVPVAKHHGSAGLTMGMKNLMGITGDNRNKWHWQLHDAISDINLAVKSHLTVIDATNIMLRNGPTGGSTSYLKKLDTVIASPNVVQADSQTSTLFGVEPESIGYLRLAEKKGIGVLKGYTAKTEKL